MTYQEVQHITYTTTKGIKCVVGNSQEAQRNAELQKKLRSAIKQNRLQKPRPAAIVKKCNSAPSLPSAASGSARDVGQIAASNKRKASPTKVYDVLETTAFHIVC